MGTVTVEEATKVLEIVAKWLGTQGMTADGSPCQTGPDAASRGIGPELVMDWDWPSSGETPTILLEGGPYDWAITFGYEDRPEIREIAPGLWTEPYSGWALCIYKED